VPEVLAVTLVVLGVMVVLVGLLSIVGGSLNRFMAAVPRYQEQLRERSAGVLRMLDGYGIRLSYERLRTVVDPAAAIGLAGNVLTQFAAILSDTVLVVLTMIFMLFEVTYVPRKLRRVLGDEQADLGRFTSVVREVNAYVVIKTYVSVATGLVIGVALAITGVDFPVLWGLVAFLLNYIPNIGSFIAAVPAVLLTVVQFGFGRAGLVAGIFVAVNTVFGNVVEPRLMGQKLGLSTLVVFVSLVFWGWLWGPLGMLLSVPLTMIVKILLQNNEQFRWVATLMDAGEGVAVKERPVAG
jgi:predicted PurR-regulated permease PerM